jgi:ABC-2 type transport system permease protein
MRNIWLVIKHDIGAILRQRSFWVMTLIMPVFLLGMNALTFIEDSQEGILGLGDEPGATPSDLPVIGLVDPAGLIAQIPEALPPELFVRFSDEASAREALAAGEVEQFVHIPADYIATGKIDVYDKEFQVALGSGATAIGMGDSGGLLSSLLAYNLAGDPRVAAALRDPVPSTQAEFHAIQPPEAGEQNAELAALVASVLPLVYYFLLLMGSTYLMRSVVAEKENRTAEVLLVSLDPRQMMIGKIVAMSAVTVIQVVVWLAGGIFLLDRGSSLLDVGSYSFPPGFLIWAVLFLVFGYLLFSSIMVAAGALANNAREGGQVTWLLIIPLMPTLMFAQAFVDEPHGTLSLVLSLFPFSAPSAMVTRMAVAAVPWWQVLLSLAGVAATAYVFVVLAGRFFRAGNLLSQQAFSWRRMLTAWRTSE